MKKYIHKILIFCCLLISPTAIYATCSTQMTQDMVKIGFTQTLIDEICESSVQTQISNMCKTQYTVCVLNETGPVTSPCWCVTSKGPKPGFLIKR